MKVTENAEEKSERMDEYDGALDVNLMRKGHGTEVYRRKHGNEYYEGNFYDDAYHGLGYYKNDSIFCNKWVYEGSFFSNAKEGYGLLSLPDNIYFEGLYENDRPFGPGVLTRSNGEQEVGFWQSSSIIRLIQPVNNEVEELSTTPIFKAFMTKFKNIVEVAPPNGVAIQVVKYINLPEEIAPKLYSIYCKDPRNFLFNYEQFEQEYFGDLTKIEDLLKVLAEDDDFSLSTTAHEITEVDQTAEHSVSHLQNPKVVAMSRKTIQQLPDRQQYREVTLNSSSTQQRLPPAQNEVTETDINSCWERIRKRIHFLLTWNNTPTMTDIMVHTFINRIYEKTVGFNVADLICNKRQKFGAPGPLEQACRGLLESCNSGNLREFTWNLFANKLNINLQDSKGNGCVLITASQDHHPLLYLLFLYGADMNIENDEGFTALNHTITRYLALLHSAGDWGKAFLPPSAAEINNANARVWRKCSQTVVTTGRAKLLKVSNRKGSKSKSLSTFSTDNRRKPSPELKGYYIFDLNPAPEPHGNCQPQTMSGKRGNPKKASPSKSSRKTTSEAFENDNEEQEALKKRKLEDVHQTLELLLTFKVNPNISRVPQPAIILAVFSGDYYLVKMLLEAGADPNARFLPEEGWLTPLHVLCLAKPQHTFPKIMNVLLQYGADPNAQASVDYAPMTKEFILQNNSETDFQIGGLTPLQALLLRVDGSYVPGKEVLKELLLRLHDITARTKYFGHSFLSMAVIRMNLAFVFTLLHIFGENPNEYLHQKWGNIATAYLKYLGKSKSPEAIIMLIELEQAGLNPLQIVKTCETIEDENVINFALKMIDHSSKRKGAHAKTSISSRTTSGIPKKLNEPDQKKPSYNNKSNEISKGSNTNRPILAQHSIGVSRMIQKGTNKRRPEMELLKKITLLQDLGRDKVDKYIRGLVIRRLLSYLRKKRTEGGVISQHDDAIQQVINWFHPTTFSVQEEFIRILTHNILAGLTFIGLEEVDQIFSIIPWEPKEHPLLTPKLRAYKDSLKPADKVLLKQVKEAIKNQLNAGISIDNLNLTRTKLREKSMASLKLRQESEISTKNKISTARQVETSKHPTKVKTTIESHHSENKAVEPLDEDELPKENAEQNELLLTQKVMEARRTELIEKLKPLLIMSLSQVRWAKRYGTKHIRIPKRANFSTDMYPEVDKSQYLYTVCYKCVKRDPSLQLCPMCKIIRYCSSKCNIRDIMNLNSNHRCKADFYGREGRWRHYGFDEDGNLLRILRKDQEDWEKEDITNDGLLKKYGNKAMLGDDTVGQDTLLSRNGDPKRGKPLADEYGGEIKRPRKTVKGSHGSNAGTMGARGFKAGTNAAHGSAKFLNGKGKGGDKGKSKNDSKREKEKARLREKKELQLREARRMRLLRKRIPHGVMGDFMRWGFIAMKYVRDKCWYKKLKGQEDQNVQDRKNAGAILSDEYLQRTHQLKVLQGLAALLGSKFNLHTLFPWVVLRDGELYYKFHSTSFVLENYSFN